MKILYDFKTTQRFVGGGSEYIRKVFYTLREYIQHEELDITIIGLYDSRIGTFAYEDLRPAALETVGVNCVDIASTTLKDVINQYKINRVFIGLGQAWINYDIENILCPIVCVIHDLWFEEFSTNHLTDYLLLDNPRRYFCHKIKELILGNKHTEGTRKLVEILSNKQYAQIVTVSEFSKMSLQYNYDLPDSKISVFYSPFRISNKNNNVENQNLQNIITDNKKYYLLVSSDRPTKNAKKTIAAFKHFCDNHHDSYIVTVGYKKTPRFPNHIVLPYLSESDLANAISHCYAFIFPSLIEGFGYPPIEAMSFGKPILCSNVTSIPEVVGNAAIYFSPYYETDIFYALNKLNITNYNTYVEKAKKRYCEIKERQDRDLMKLIRLIIGNNEY